MHSIFQISISRNTKCAHKVGFRKSGHICLFIHAMDKTTIFIFQLCVVFDLFAIKAVKRHFRLDFVTSHWLMAIIDFH